MRKKQRMVLLPAFLILTLIFSGISGCGVRKKEAVVDEIVEVASSSVSVNTESETPDPIKAEPVQAAEPPEGTYFSELTGEPVSEELKNQRPIAVMVDNETIAYPHYGIAEGDVLYELMNSTLNGRITRFMVLLKDYGKIQQMGSIRSTRPTNIILASEWNAILCHDGGPGYVKEYFAKDYAQQHFSGTFSRVDNGKPREFTEYILPGDLDSNFGRTGWSREYNEFRPQQETHFQFVDYETERDLTETSDGSDCAGVVLPFPHTQSTLTYNRETGTYDYSAYGNQHKDAEDDQVLTFKNVLIQKCAFTQYDENGYMIYNVIQSGQPGYYLTNGHKIPITWSKDSETGITHYYDAGGNELRINRGKTYITLVPDDSWDAVAFS